MENHALTGNRVIINGTVMDSLKLSHQLYGESFYEFFVSVPRLSKFCDILPVTVSDRLIPHIDINTDEPIMIEGQLRSYNKNIDGANRLILTIFARRIDAEQSDGTANEIELEGYVCKPPVYRTTPFNREITDLLLAVNRSYSKSDYIPCIAWSRNAQYAATLEVGDKVKVMGRVQSREYDKALENGEVARRTAYEVSVSRIDSIKT